MPSLRSTESISSMISKTIRIWLASRRMLLVRIMKQSSCWILPQIGATSALMAPRQLTAILSSKWKATSFTPFMPEKAIRKSIPRLPSPSCLCWYCKAHSAMITPKEACHCILLMPQSQPSP